MICYLLHTAILADLYTFPSSQQRTMLTIQYNLASRLSRRFVGDSSLHPASCTPHVVVARRLDSFFVVPWTISADPAPGCHQALTVHLRGDPPNCMKTERSLALRSESSCHHVALSFFVSRLGKWLACRAYVCMVRVFIKHTISFYISSFTPLYVYTSYHLFPSPALRDSRDAKTAPPLQSSSSNRRRAHGDAVAEPRSMSLTACICRSS